MSHPTHRYYLYRDRRARLVEGSCHEDVWKFASSLTKIEDWRFGKAQPGDVLFRVVKPRHRVLIHDGRFRFSGSRVMSESGMHVIGCVLARIDEDGKAKFIEPIEEETA